MTNLAPTAFRVVAPSDSIPDNHVVPFYLADRKLRISIARVEGHLYAFDDLCTCSSEQCPLSSGLLEGTTLMCQCHGSRYDIRTGAVISRPAIDPLRTYATEEVDGHVRVLA
jgi:nitrite reductase/ring-hydroxylating ferredoxin subunit